MWAVDADGRICWGNAALQQLTGRSTASLVGVKADAIRAELFGAATAGGELHLPAAAGRPACWFEVVATPIADGELAGGILEQFRDITSRKRSEGGLQDSERRYRQLFENNPQPMWVCDIETRAFLAVNQAAIDHYGFSRNEFLAMTTMELEPDRRTPSSLGPVARNAEAPFQSTRRQHRRKDGSLIEVAIASRALTFAGRKAALSLITDITAQLRTETDLKASEEKYRLLVENQSDLVVKIDTAGRLLFVSPSYCSLFGQKEEDLLGCRFMPLVHEEDRTATTQAMASLWRPPHKVYLEQRVMAKEGCRWLAWMNNAILDERGRVTAVIGVGRDITERKEAEKKLKHREALECLIAAISTRFLKLSPSQTSRGIRFALERLGCFAGADRGFILRWMPDGQRMRYTTEWCAEGVASARAVRRELMAIELPWAANQILSQRSLYVPSLDELPPEAGMEKARWERRGIRSLVAVPLVSAGVVVGAMAFESQRSEKIWERSDVVLLRTVGGIIGSALERQHSVAELRQALAATQEARDKVDGILQSVAEGLIVTDASGIITLVNSSAEELLGIDARQAEGRFLPELLPDAGLPATLEENLTAGRTGRFETTFPGDDPDRPRIIKGATALLRDRRGRTNGLIATFADVTREREIDRMKTEFISTAAHELRTPVTAIRGFSEVLSSGEPLQADERDRFLACINDQSVTLSALVGELLDIARLEAGGTLSLHRECCTVVNCASQLEPFLHYRSSGHVIELDLSDSETEISVDRGKIGQVMENLLSNAVKYSPAGGTIRLVGRRDGDEYRLEISDEGIGMTSEQVARVFDKFYRADASNTAIGGIGLGMSIVKNIIEAHGGRIWLESAPGEGTTVTFTLPLGSAGGENCQGRNIQ